MSESGDGTIDHCPSESNDRDSVCSTNSESNEASPIKETILKHSMFGNSFAGFSSTSENSFFKSAVLRPSKLGQSSAPSSTSTNTTVTNPFKRSFSDETPDDESPKKAKPTEDEDEKSVSSTTVQFVPLNASHSGNSHGPPPAIPTSSTNSHATMFVFGKNLHERVEGVEMAAADEPTTSTTNATAPITSNGSIDSENLITSAVNKIEKSNNGEATTVNGTAEKKSLSEAAREYEESIAQKTKYDEVQVVTGEEDEENVLQISCKLFAFDQTTKNWQERGRSTLRLNDYDSREDGERAKSRLVVRASGSLRVVLNTKIWAGMSVEVANEKSLRLTAMDNLGVIKVFLVVAGKKEVDKLYALLKSRVKNEIARAESSTRPSDVTDSVAPSTSDISATDETEEPTSTVPTTE